MKYNIHVHYFNDGKIFSYVLYSLHIVNYMHNFRYIKITIYNTQNAIVYTI